MYNFKWRLFIEETDGNTGFTEEKRLLIYTDKELEAQINYQVGRGAKIKSIELVE